MKPSLPPLKGGFLRLHGKDLNRLLRLSDPGLLTALFVAIQRHSRPVEITIALAVFLFIALVLPSGKLYRSYRQSSLWVLMRRVALSWALVLTGLLFIAFLLKVSADYSRQDMVLWAVLGWVQLLGCAQ